jgi:aminoglycoside phosphotransferase family enzyme/predicted kinase
MSNTDQSEVVAFLSRGEAYGRPDLPVEHMETHAAMVFLVGDRAFKMKRTVRYSFLDFSTLARRRNALTAELKLNRRTAPALYRGLVRVTRDRDGRLDLDGAGRAVEWLIEMRRFRQADLLSNVAARGELDGALVEALAREIARFHRSAEPRPQHGGYAGLREVVAGNAGDLAALAGGGVFDRAEVDDVNTRTASTLEAQHSLLERRRRAGQVRWCHGDLHLGNLVLWEGRPVAFDCLEFDPALASTDTLYDLAFLIMDLLARDLAAPAQQLLGAYLDETGEADGLALLPLFLSVRAAIRAKVVGLAAGSDPDAPSAAGSAAQRRQARGYLQLARTLIDPPPPRLIAIGGISGTGKSTLARALAPGLGAPPGAIVLRSDLIRKALFGVAATTRLPEEAYRPEVSRLVFARLAEQAEDLLRAGRTVIADAVFGHGDHRALIERAAKRAGCPFTGLWLEAPAPELAARIEARRGDASDATVEVMQRQLRTGDVKVRWARIQASGDPDTVTARARGALMRTAETKPMKPMKRKT